MLRTKLTLSTLAVTIVLAGCSTQMTQPVQKDVSATKVEAVKVDSTMLDLGYKNGTSLKVKVGVNGEKTPFGIKAISAGVFVPTVADLATKPGTMLKIKLHKVNNSAGFNPPMDRFNSTTAVPEISFVGPFDGLSTTPTIPFNITFRGLQPGQDYLVSARLYDAPVSVPNLNVDITSGVVSRASTTPGTNPVVFPSSFAFELNDLLDINGTICRVTNIAPLTVVVASTGLAPSDGTDILFNGYQRNIVGVGDEGAPSTSGKGMAVNGNATGGGTASAGASGVNEEIARVMPDGLLSIINDVAPANNLDLKIQLRRSVNPEVTGSVTVVNGTAAGASESITQP
ncbi:MAG: hypothetical protein ACK4IX_11015 [Candidatus Sericytochromatia bacterium]